MCRGRVCSALLLLSVVLFSILEHSYCEEDAAPPKLNLEELKQDARSPSATHRLHSALLLSEFTREQNQELLSELLKDNDPVVRRAAAESFYGAKDFRKHGNPKRHDFETVLKAEEKARTLFSDIKKAKNVYESTQRLIHLGWLAILEIGKHVNDLENSEGLSATYARQEILANRKNIFPDWAEKIRKNLKKTISLDFKEMQTMEMFRQFGKQIDIPIKIRQEFELGREKEAASIHFTDAKAVVVLQWLSRLADAEFLLKEESLYFTKSTLWDGATRILLDVRDLEEHDNYAWAKLLSAEVPEAWERFSPEQGTSYEYKNGFLIFWSPTCGGDPQGRWTLKPIAIFLNKLRAKRRLAEIPWAIRTFSDDNFDLDWQQVPKTIIPTKPD